MNKENAHLYLPYVQALADGKTIQQASGEEWLNIEDPTFHRYPEYYRVEPEPLEANIWVCNKTGKTQNSTLSAVGTTHCDGTTVRLFREVL